MELLIINSLSPGGRGLEPALIPVLPVLSEVEGMGEDKGGGEILSVFPPHPSPLPPGERELIISSSRAEIVDYQANSVKIEARMNEEGFLVLSDTYYPGWRVWVNGREEKIYCADYLLRAVHLSPGFHQVRFVFDPLSFKLGLWMALSTMVCSGGFLVFSRLPRKK